MMAGVTAPRLDPNLDPPLSVEGSEALLERARLAIPGGVNSPVRAFRAVGGTPVFMRSGEGA